MARVEISTVDYVPWSPYGGERRTILVTLSEKNLRRLLEDFEDGNLARLYNPHVEVDGELCADSHMLILDVESDEIHYANEIRKAAKAAVQR